MAALDWQGWLTIGIVLATLALLLWERFTPDKVLLGAVALLIGSGILGPREALAGFWNPGVLTVAVLFVLVAALKSTGAIRWIGDWVLGQPRGEWRAQARLVVIASPLSAFVNNTPIVAMLTSAIEHWSRRSHVAPSKLLLPMNYATILGGMCTLVGTSTNLIVAGLVLQHGGLRPLGMFDPLGVGAVAVLAGGVYLLLASRWLLPERRPALQPEHAAHGHTVVEVVLSPFSPAVGHPLAESGFRRHYGATVTAVARGGEPVPRKLSDVVLQAGDTLLLDTDAGFARRHGGSADFMLVDEVDAAPSVDRPRALAALAVIALMIVANTVFGVDILVSALVAALLVLLARCVEVGELRRSVDLRLIVVIACSFALGAALDSSGVAALAASQLTGLAGADPFLTLVLVYIATVVATELITNNAAAVLMFPVAMAAAEGLGVQPMPFVIATMMAASAGFITPIGYQTNLMVYGPGGYRFADYVRFGLPLSLVVGTAVLWAIPVFWPF